jgi:hypothetical protein
MARLSGYETMRRLKDRYTTEDRPQFTEKVQNYRKEFLVIGDEFEYI